MKWRHFGHAEKQLQLSMLTLTDLHVTINTWNVFIFQKANIEVTITQNEKLRYAER